MRSLLLSIVVVFYLSVPPALAENRATTVYCGKNWITFVAQLKVAKVKLDRRGFTIRKSQVLTVTADMPNNDHIVMARSSRDSKVIIFYHVTRVDYTKIIGCLD